MPTKVEKDSFTGRETTGHEWDGIRELNTPLPRWWLYTFYACIAFAAVYAVLFPAVPWVTGHTKGLLGYTNRGAVDKEMAALATSQAPILAKISAADLETIRRDPQLFAFAEIGRASWRERV